MSLKSDVKEVKQKVESLRAGRSDETVTKKTTLGTVVNPKSKSTLDDSEPTENTPAGFTPRWG